MPKLAKFRERKTSKISIKCQILSHEGLNNESIVRVFTSTGVTGYKGIRVTFLHLNTLQKVTLIPLYPVTPVLVNTPNM